MSTGAVIACTEQGLAAQLRELLGELGDIEVLAVAESTSELETAVLEREPGNAEAAAVLLEALAHRSPGVRDEAFSVFESLGEGGEAVLGAVQEGAAPGPAPEASEVAS